MANMNVRTPRFYPDLINFFLNRGVAQDGSFDVTATGGSGDTATRGIQNGTEAELFDMKPLNKVDFDTTGDPNSQVLITLDLQGTYKKSYIAILNHNLSSASGKIRIFAGDEASDITAVDGANAETGDISWGSVTVTEVVNADNRTADGDNKSFVIEPAADGSTIFTFPESALRYWAIQFEGGGSGAAKDENWGGTDLFVGGIMIGEYYDMPHAPDLSVKRSIQFDGNDVLESAGGQRFSNQNYYGRQVSSTTLSPFATNQYARNLYGGRIVYDMNFSYLNSTDVMPTEYHTHNVTDDSVVDDIWNKTGGSHIPFIFSCDKDSEGDNAESEHIFARFGQNSLDMTQVANDVWNIKMRIEEEF